MRLFLPIFLSPFLLLFVQTALANQYTFYTQEYPPYSFEAQGRVTGIIPDIVHELCQKMNLNCKIEIAPFKRALTSLENGEVHGVLTLVKSEGRDSYAHFLSIQKKFNYVFVTSGSAGPVQGLVDLHEWTVGVLGDSFSGHLLKSFTVDHKLKINVIDELDSMTLINKLQNRRYGTKGGVILSEDMFHFHEKRFGLKGLKKRFVVKSNDLGIYFSKHNVDTELLARFGQAFDQLKTSGQLKKLQKKHTALLN